MACRQTTLAERGLIIWRNYWQTSSRRTEKLEARIADLQSLNWFRRTVQVLCHKCISGIQSTSTPFPDGAAFSAYVSVHETDISKDFTIHFDTIVTNIGSHYNKHTGAFTTPQHGVYVFTWNLYCNTGGYIQSQLVVNSNVVGAMLTSAQGSSNIRSHTGIVVVEVNQGDVVFVRTHPTHIHIGNLYSDIDWRSSFNGWKLY